MICLTTLSIRFENPSSFNVAVWWLFEKVISTVPQSTFYLFLKGLQGSSLVSTTPSWCIMWTAVLVPVCSTPSIQPRAMHLKPRESPTASFFYTRHLCDLLTCSDVCAQTTGPTGGGREWEERQKLEADSSSRGFQMELFMEMEYVKDRERERKRKSERGDDNDQMSDWNLIHLMRWSSMLGCACSSHGGIRDLTHLQAMWDLYIVVIHKMCRNIIGIHQDALYWLIIY